MIITSIDVFDYEIRFAHGTYAMSHGRTSTGHRSFVVRVTTGDGVEGWGETCPHGATYLHAFPEGELAALELLAEALPGRDPANPAAINRAMDETMLGGQGAKSALDAACLDILGKAAGVPMATLLGGVLAESFDLFIAVPVDTPDAMAAYAEREVANGIRKVQVKVGDEPAIDVARVRAVHDAVGSRATLIADANGGWSVTSALVACRQLQDLPIHLEQPCRTLADCAELRRHCALPIILDECVLSLADLVAGKQVGATGVNLKPGRLGGMTRLRVLRDAAVALGMTVSIDDTWGGSLVTAQNAHLAASTEPASLLAADFFADWTEPDVSTRPVTLPSGQGVVPAGPGLGVEVDVAALNGPIFSKRLQARN